MYVPTPCPVAFELRYLVALTRKRVKPLSRRGRPLSTEMPRWIEVYWLQFATILIRTYTGTSHIEIIFSTSARYLDYPVGRLAAPDGSTQRVTLVPSYPNPVNTTTILRYALSTASRVRLAILDMRGREVVSLVDRPHLAGWYRMPWDGCDTQGIPVASGLYFCLLHTEQGLAVQKLLVIR